MDYNTQREKMHLPEYGRHVQEMIEYVKSIPDKEKRNEQIKTVVSVMGILNPQLKDVVDYKHKLWDHVQIISDFEIDIDAPYPIPTRENYSAKPDMIPIEKRPLAAAHYGRNIQNMVDAIAERPDGELKDMMIKTMASYMRQQYLIWNKDTVSESTIFADIAKLSKGKLIVPEHIHLETISDKETFTRPGIMAQNPNITGNQHQMQRRKGNNNKKKNNKNRWKNNNPGNK